jgi:O-antigen/teichoic acid export membrane protein
LLYALMWKIYKNTAYMVWSGVMSMVNSLLVWAIVARYLGQTAFGHFTLIMAIYLVFLNVCSLGLGPLILREAAGDRADRSRFIASAALVLALAGILWSGLMMATGLVLGAESEALWPLAILSLSLLASALIAGCESLLIAGERASMIASVTTGENILKALIPWGLISFGFGLPAVCVTFSTLRFGTLAVYLLGLRHQSIPLAWREPLSCVREIIKHTPSFLFINLFAGLHWQLGILLLTRMQDTADVAMYGAASRLLVPWTLLCVSYAASISPTMCQLTTRSLADMGRFCRHSISNLLVVLLPLAVGTHLVSSQVIHFIFGLGYEGAVAPLRMLIWSLIPLGIVLVLSRGLLAVRKQNVDLRSNALAVAVNMGLNLWLIPRYGALGAAAAQLISVTLLFAVQLAYVSWSLFQVRIISLIGRFAVAVGAMAALVSLLQIRTLWVTVPLGVIIYFGCLLALGWRPALKF